MTEEKTLFSDAVPVRDRAPAYGFRERGDALFYARPLCDGQFLFEAAIAPSGEVSARLTDVQTQSEYVLHRIEGAQGAFVGRVREEYLAALREIRAACFERNAFRADVSRALLDYARERYGDRPEYLWERSPSNAVLRRRDNRKWYAAFLTVAADKLGLPRTDVVEIVDLRMRPQELDARADGVKYFRGWHMNKKSWVTALLDGTVPVGELRNLLDESYRLAGEK